MKTTAKTSSTKRTRTPKIERLEWSTGLVATELTGKYGALYGAWRKLSALGHLATGQGVSFECAHCCKTAHVEPVDGGFVLRGDAATACTAAR